jgi:hypothetical protein
VRGQYDARRTDVERERHGLATSNAELGRDAARWRHCEEHGFPVRNQTATPGYQWVAFRVVDGQYYSSFGETAVAAVDAAIAAGDGR